MNIKSFVPTLLLLVVVAAVAYTAGNKGLPNELKELGNLVGKETEKNDNKNESTGADIASISMEDSKQKILKSIQALDESVEGIELEQTPVKGVYWVLLPGNEVLLMSADGRFVLGRGINEFKDGKLEPVLSTVVELAKQGAQTDVQAAFRSKDNHQLIYKAVGEKKAEVFVFTDVNCGYCRKFHKDVPELTQAGIEVHYFAGPFFSKDRESLEKIWCSADPLMAMNEAKAGQKLSGINVTDECVAIVSEHIALGQKLGIRGTPAIYTKDGEQLGGYVPPQQLIERLTKG